MKASILNRKTIAEGTVQIDFALDNTVNFTPGQYLNLTLINPPYNDNRGNMRIFSIVSEPGQNVLSIATRLTGSAFKNSLNELPLGTLVEISNIGGHFVLPPATKQPIVFIAGGIGITPFVSMIKDATSRNLPYHLTLLYFNRNQKSTAFLQELESLAASNSNFKLILSMTEDDNWSGEKRIVNADLIKELIPDYSTDYFMTAGPPKMVDGVFEILNSLSVNPENIAKENFSGY